VGRFFPRYSGGSRRRGPETRLLSGAQRLYTLFILCGVLAAPSAAHAQAWTRERGEVYFKLSYGTATASDQYGFDGQVKPYADNVSSDAFFDRSLYFYSEVGLTKDVTFTFALPYKRIILRDAAFRYDTAELGTLGLGARFALTPLFSKSLPSGALSINTRLNLPLGYVRNYVPSAGAGQIDVDTTIDFGYSFYPVPIYAQIGFGYKFRTPAYLLSRSVPCEAGHDIGCFADKQPTLGDEFLLAIEVGYTLKRWALFQFITRGAFSVYAPDVGFSVTQPIPTRERYLKVGGGITFYPVGRFGIGMQAFFTPYGENTLKSVDLFLGLEIMVDIWGGKKS
jgi:hypothetical protein